MSYIIFANIKPSSKKNRGGYPNNSENSPTAKTGEYIIWGYSMTTT